MMLSEMIPFFSKRPPAKFKKGDSVQLEGGGPLMVVRAVLYDNQTVAFRCQWYDPEHDTTREGVFSGEVLKPFDRYNPQ